jgi:hypothetical protein
MIEIRTRNHSGRFITAQVVGLRKPDRGAYIKQVRNMFKRDPDFVFAGPGSMMFPHPNFRWDLGIKTAAHEAVEFIKQSLLDAATDLGYRESEIVFCSKWP